MDFASLTRTTLRRRLLPALIAVVLFASFATASHYHRDELGQRADTHVQCLLCLHLGASAGAPHIPAMSRPVVVVLTGRLIASTPLRESFRVASYDARGPPEV
jgi:hypothetical protein